MLIELTTIFAIVIPLYLFCAWWKNTSDTEKLHEKWRKDKKD